MATKVPSTENTYHPSCFERVKESKWTDVALVAGCIACLLIAILASSGVLNFMGAHAVSQLSYAMYACAAIFLIVEVMKVAINRCGSKPDNDPIGGTSETQQVVNKLPWTPLERNDSRKKEIDRLVMIVKYSQSHSTLSVPSVPPLGWKETVIHSYQMTPDNAQEVCNEIKGSIDQCTASSQWTSIRAPERFDRKVNNGLITLDLCVLERISS